MNIEMNTREKIIETATALFLRKGYESVSLNEIAGEVGIAKPSIYHYFNGKEALFREVIEMFFAEGKKWMEPFRDEGSTLEDAVKGILKSAEQTLELINASYSDEAEGRYGYYFLMFDALKMFPDIRKKYEDSYIEDFETVKNAFSLAKSEKEIRKDAEWRQFAIALSAVIEGLFLINTLYPSLELKGFPESVTDILFKGIIAGKEKR